MTVLAEKPKRLSIRPRSLSLRIAYNTTMDAPWTPTKPNAAAIWRNLIHEYGTGRP
jgi:hypothetical protein